VISLEASEDAVTAVVRTRETGAERIVRARYAVAAASNRTALDWLEVVS
jgi:hypothetical protein